MTDYTADDDEHPSEEEEDEQASHPECTASYSPATDCLYLARKCINCICSNMYIFYLLNRITDDPDSHSVIRKLHKIQ